MAVHLSRRAGRAEPTVHQSGEPDTIVILAVLGGILALIIAVWIWLG
jgi:hypothetical protein